MAVVGGPVVARGTIPAKELPLATKRRANGPMYTSLAKRVLLPIARTAAANPSAAVTPAPSLRPSWTVVRIGSTSTEVRMPIRRATALTLSRPKLVVALRRTRAAAAVQAPQDAWTAIAPRRTIGALVTVILGTYAELVAPQRLASSLLADVRRLSCATRGLVRTTSDAFPRPVDQARFTARSNKAYKPRTGTPTRR